MDLAALAEKRTLCFGGSFNPIHHGHLITARAVAEAAGFERVLLIPSCQPPHKLQNSDIAEARHRLAMCRLAVEGDPLFEVSEIELLRNGPSYTIDTVRELRGHGWRKIHWLMGMDMLEILPKWREPHALMAEVEFIVMARPGWSLKGDALPEEFRGLIRNNVVEAPLLQISATDIRRRVAAELSISYLVPEAVREYIGQHHLYGGVK